MSLLLIMRFLLWDVNSALGFSESRAQESQHWIFFFLNFILSSSTVPCIPWYKSPSVLPFVELLVFWWSEIRGFSSILTILALQIFGDDFVSEFLAQIKVLIIKWLCCFVFILFE